MKLLVGCSSPPDRGSGILTYSKELTEQLLIRGIEVHFVSPKPKDATWIKQHRIPQVSFDQHDEPRDAASKLLRYIRDHDIDAVINNDNSLVQSIAPGLSCPFIAIGHLGQTSIASLACYRPEWSDYVVSISADMQRTFVLKYGVPLAKCPIIHNGVRDFGHDGNFVSRDTRSLRAIFVGGYNRRLKGADLVLSAVLQSEDRWRGIRLDWYGVGLPDHVSQRLSNLRHVHVHERVPREQLLEAMRESDVLLFPSRIEGCPMAMLEAMSMGVVPIASDGEGAMRWLVNIGKDGYVCHLADWPDQMLACLRHLADHPAMLSAMKLAARERFLRDFQSSRVADDILRLISAPTVDRTHPAPRITVLRWHRPLRPDGLKSPLLDRIYFRLARLRIAGTLALSSTAA